MLDTTSYLCIGCPLGCRLEVDEDGLDALDRRYLNALVNTYAGGPVGADTLAAALSEARDSIEEVIEPYLMQKGLVARTPRGRVATPGAWERMGLKAPASFQPPLFEDEAFTKETGQEDS